MRVRSAAMEFGLLLVEEGAECACEILGRRAYGEAVAFAVELIGVSGILTVSDEMLDFAECDRRSRG